MCKSTILQEYSKIKKMDLVKDVRNIKFIPVQSVLPFYTAEVKATDKVKQIDPVAIKRFFFGESALTIAYD